MNSTSESILKNEIKLDVVFRILYSKKKKYIPLLAIAAILSSALILCVPRYYTSSVMLAPEYNNPTSNLGGLGSLASSFGVNLGNATSEDAITPTFYPDLMESTSFLAPLLDIKVSTKEKSYRGSYADYLLNHQDAPFWENLFKLKKKNNGNNPMSSANINPYSLTLEEAELLQTVTKRISCIVDKKTNVISLKCTDQDPMVATIMADSIMAHLQTFITNYRTQKARVDLANIQQLSEKAYKEYKATLSKYSSFVDEHNELTLPSMIAKQDELENNMQSAYNTYNTLQQRQQMAEAKVQERTPAFTIIQNATVPVKPAGPKRMIFVLASTLLMFIVSSFFFIIKEYH